MYNENKSNVSRRLFSDQLMQKALRDDQYGNHTDCDCAPTCQTCEHDFDSDNRLPELRGFPLASVYSPIQEWQKIYETDVGFSKGTIFMELDLPFVCGEKKGGCGCAK